MNNHLSEDAVEFDVIYSYTRKQAIADGVLVDVSETAKEAGINFQVSLTSTVWGHFVVPPVNLESCGQSVTGRLWDLLWMFRMQALKTNSSLLFFTCIFLNEHETREEVKLKAFCGPGDNMEPVITIMLPEED